ncbi:MAG TPA: 1-deoxy-D-xylulose-5-phosphate reductoisomerase [Phycisphaerae bacterium]|nr:1-deoxy-D-xylulose-5-phosphate reductoisomerase [Phycisphaerae bacterium]
MKQKVIILGSTGSIGQNTLQVLAQHADAFDVVGLGAGTRWKALATQARYWKPQCVALANGAHAELAGAAPAGCRVITGPDALTRLVEETPCDCVVSAIVGAAGLPATLRAVELGRKVAIANKEALVVAGSVLMPLARRTGATILPIDSEHSAVFQALQAGRREDVERIVLTASGGPFRTATPAELARVTPADALQHPTWDMGPKITIDSATMMNKALEIIEARWLFDMPHDRIDVVIHPESIVHSLVEYRDGSVIAQLGTPDMRTPIQYALTYPQRLPCPAERLCLHTLGKMTFFAPDAERFPALRIGHAVAQRGGTLGAVLNAANEEANKLFRSGAIAFTDIAALTEEVLDQHDCIAEPDLPALLAADGWARQRLAQCAARITEHAARSR